MRKYVKHIHPQIETHFPLHEWNAETHFAQDI